MIVYRKMWTIKCHINFIKNRISECQRDRSITLQLRESQKKKFDLRHSEKGTSMREAYTAKRRKLVVKMRFHLCGLRFPAAMRKSVLLLGQYPNCFRTCTRSLMSASDSTLFFLPFAHLCLLLFLSRVFPLLLGDTRLSTRLNFLVLDDDAESSLAFPLEAPWIDHEEWSDSRYRSRLYTTCFLTFPLFSFFFSLIFHMYSIIQQQIEQRQNVFVHSQVLMNFLVNLKACVSWQKLKLYKCLLGKVIKRWRNVSR